MATTRDGRLAYVGCNDGRIQIIDLSSGKALRSIPHAHAQCIVSLHLSGDEKWLVSGGAEDKIVRLWNVEDTIPAQVGTFEGHRTPVCCARLSTDRARVLGVAEDGTVIVWEANSGRQLWKLGSQFDEHVEVAAEFTPDGKELVVSAQDGSLARWDIDGNRKVQSFRGHTKPCHVAAFSPDTKYLFSASFDGTFCIWNAQTGQELFHSAVPEGAFRTAVQSSLSWNLIAMQAKSQQLVLWTACRKTDSKEVMKRTTNFEPSPQKNRQTAARAVAYYHKAAENGNPFAQYYLGQVYLLGIDEPADLANAEAWLTKAAENGNDGAQGQLAACYLGNAGFKANGEKAYKWATKAAEQENSLGMFVLGKCYLEGQGVLKDMATGVKWLRKGVDKGSSTAMTQLAICYLNGIGVEADRSAAVVLLKKAAKLGEKYAENMLKEIGR